MQRDYSDLPYPVKYGVIPIYALSKGDKFPLSYIVSKVFVTIESDVYTEKGHHKEFFIVPPVKGYSAFYASADIRIPIFDKTGHCINQEPSKYVFETYEDAKKTCDTLNGGLYRTVYAYDDFMNRKNIFQNFENEVMMKTSECKMGISKVKRR